MQTQVKDENAPKENIVKVREETKPPSPGNQAKMRESKKATNYSSRLQTKEYSSNASQNSQRWQELMQGTQRQRRLKKELEKLREEY